MAMMLRRGNDLQVNALIQVDDSYIYIYIHIIYAALFSNFFHKCLRHLNQNPTCPRDTEKQVAPVIPSSHASETT